MGMHALLLDQVMIEVESHWFVDMHCIPYQKCTLDSLGHHALKCAIDGPKTKDHGPLSHKHDKGCDWCIHCLNCIAMLCLALCCCQLQILQELSADRQF